MPSLLVTNDFPPKHGGIQTYLYELWRRLPPEATTVLTTAYPGAAAWDARQAFRVERLDRSMLWPTAGLARRVDAFAREVGAGVVFCDPMLPLGHIGPRLTAAPYAVVAHGAEMTAYGRLPVTRPFAARVLHGAAGIVAAGTYPAREAVRAAGRPLLGIVIPPGVDCTRFRPLGDDARAEARAHFGLDPDRPLVLGVSRLVPRKGFDVVIDAIAPLADVQLAIAGAGRDRARLERRARSRAPGRVTFLGRVPDETLPALYACADVFAMCCRERWGGLEAEGFGIVFLEAAAAGVPAVAGRSGGAHEAVADGESGFVVRPRAVAAVRDAIELLVRDEALRSSMGAAARRRAEEHFSYDRLVGGLVGPACGDLGSLSPLER